MFPVTITLHNADQLNAVVAALGGNSAPAASKPVVAKEQPKAEVAKKPEPVAEKPAATEPVATQATAEVSAAPEKKAEESAKPATLSVDERAALIKTLAGNGKRDEVVALLGKYGAKKGSEVKEDDLPAFDAELKAL